MSIQTPSNEGFVYRGGSAFCQKGLLESLPRVPMLSDMQRRPVATTGS
jgi:hypothetical protein